MDLRRLGLAHLPNPPLLDHERGLRRRPAAVGTPPWRGGTGLQRPKRPGPQWPGPLTMRAGRHFIGCTDGGVGYLEQTSIGGRRRLAPDAGLTAVAGSEPLLLDDET
jgi:hypothetical protein